MNTFLSGLTTNDVRGENDMPAHSTSDSAVLDLFFLLGTRPSKEKVETAVVRAWAEDPTLTLKSLFQSRDIRHGKGERESFRTALKLLAGKDGLSHLIRLVPEFGRWDDLHVLEGTPLESTALDAIANGLLSSKDGLCAKWQPRKGRFAEKLRKRLGMTPKTYRKTLVGMTKVVESLMCAQQWGGINYSHVPSRASSIYHKAFARHDAERYAQWKEDLKKPKGETEAKINVGALYPHEVVKKARQEAVYPFEEAWSAMQEAFPETSEKIVPVCDVSGSMCGLPLEVSVALGLFLSQRNRGPFADCFITFSGRPKLQKLAGSLLQRVSQLERAEWEMNTNLEAVFRLVASAAKTANPEDVPTMILIMSDMQFDQAARSPSANALKMIDEEFAALGIERPKIVFWNLRDAGAGTLPVKAHQSGAALVSGFSPSLLKGLLGNPRDFTPLGIMLNALMSPRYADIHV